MRNKSPERVIRHTELEPSRILEINIKIDEIKTSMKGWNTAKKRISGQQNRYLKWPKMKSREIRDENNENQVNDIIKMVT